MSVTGVLATCAGFGLIGVSLQDAFEVVLLPRPVQRRVRLMHYFFRATWAVWVRIGARLPPGPKREGVLGVYGPSSMVLLFSLWALCLIVGFGLLQWSLPGLYGSEPGPTLTERLFMSGSAFFTLGDSSSTKDLAVIRILVIAEAGTGFGFIALTISYLPVLQQHFFQRDMQLIQLAARAGSPPTSVALILWHVTGGDVVRLENWLREWEVWCAELIESHSSYPMLAFYRSQHDNHSWLSSLAVVLDCCALLLAGFPEQPLHQTESTFMVARRVLLELCRSLDLQTEPGVVVRAVDRAEFTQITAAFEGFGDAWTDTVETQAYLTSLRGTYASLLTALSTYLLLPLPGWLPPLCAGANRVRSRRSVIDRLTQDREDTPKAARNRKGYSSHQHPDRTARGGRSTKVDADREHFADDRR